MKLPKKMKNLSKESTIAAYDKCYAIAKLGTSKVERSLAFSEVKEEIKASFTEEEIEEFGGMISSYFGKAQKSSRS